MKDPIYAVKVHLINKETKNRDYYIEHMKRSEYSQERVQEIRINALKMFPNSKITHCQEGYYLGK